MDFGLATFWVFLAATVVASLTFVAVVVWSGSRVKERQEYYRFEFRKSMVEAGKLDSEALASLMRYEHELAQRQRPLRKRSEKSALLT